MTLVASKHVRPVAGGAPRIALPLPPRLAARRASWREQLVFDIFDGRFDQGSPTNDPTGPGGERAIESRRYPASPLHYFLDHLAALLAKDS